MDLSQPGHVLIALPDEPESHDQGESEGEAHEEHRVLAARTEHLDRADRAPENGSGDERVHEWAGEAVGGVHGADSRDVPHLWASLAMLSQSGRGSECDDFIPGSSKRRCKQRLRSALRTSARRRSGAEGS